MEAPEKIYINLNLENRTWLIGKGDISFIEYTRTDAFIEKACEWLKENCKSYIIVDIDNKYKGLDGLFLEDFRNYMKGG